MKAFFITIGRAIFMAGLLALYVLSIERMAPGYSTFGLDEASWLFNGWMVLYLYLVLATGNMQFAWEPKSRSDAMVLICGFVSIVIMAGSASALSFKTWQEIAIPVATVLGIGGVFWWIGCASARRYEQIHQDE